MASPGHFHVQTRLVEILGGLYRSTEEALKEFVANSWDADATRVDITLPLAFAGQPITVRDDGCGMTRQEVEAHYLGVAVDRRSISGETTPKGRRVRGYRGIGKFAGFVAADRMVMTTVARGTRSRLVLDRKDLLGQDEDLEAVNLPIVNEPWDGPSGTSIELSLLRPGFEQPSPKKLGAILLREFGVRDDFAVFIDEVRLTPDVLEGKKVQFELPLSDNTKAEVTTWFLSKERGVVDTGFVLRVDDRAVGPASYYGLDDDPEVPRSALRRMYVEVRANHLRDYVTANWSGVIENSTVYQELQREVGAAVKKQVLDLLEGESSETEEQFVERYAQQLELLPLSHREQARRALLRVFKKLFAEAPDRKHVVAELVLNVFEQDRYWLIARRLDEIQPGDLVKLAKVLHDWGIGDVAEVAARAKERLRFLDHFEQLATATETLEFSGIHRVIQTNPWLVGDEFELWVSNRSMRRTVEEFAQKTYQESNGTKRPDLLLVGLGDRRLLIELKRPSWQVTWADVAQVKEYRDSLHPYFPNAQFVVRVLGGTAKPHMAREEGASLRISTYTELVDEARRRLRWLLDNLDSEVQGSVAPLQERLEL